MTTTSKQCGFTLVELLIVIAIIALLVSILLPSLSKARQLARKAVCSTNLRGLAVANSIYAEENDSHYVLAAKDMWGDNLKRWHGERDEINEVFDPQEGPMRPQLGSNGIKQCPSFTDALETAGQSAAFEAGCGGYGYNASYVGARTDRYGAAAEAFLHSAAASDVRVPAETIMFTDTAYAEEVGDSRRKIAYSFCEPPFWQLQAGGPPSNSRPNPTVHFRHLGKANVAWMDGHVSSRQLQFSFSYSTHSRLSADEAAKQGLGWFSPEDNSLFDLQ